MIRGIRVVDVFATRPRDGNPAPIVVNATSMSDTEMQDVARRHERESGFVLPGSGAHVETGRHQGRVDALPDSTAAPDRYLPPVHDGSSPGSPSRA